MSLGVGIIGAGLIGSKRASALRGGRLIAVSDLEAPKAHALAQSHQAQVETDWQALVKRKDIEAVLVCVTNDSLVPCSLAALEAGKHVLVEKPAGRNAKEVERLERAAAESSRIVRVGFNHRFHPGLQKMKRLMELGAVGPLMYIRARYGHGGRLGYEKEWRADPLKSGGGELLDQGVHLIDLSRWLGGEFELSWGQAKTYFWKMPVEDNGFLFLESPDKKRSAFLHASCSEWKNLFDFEVFGRTGKLHVSGLGRSYGDEELRYYRMKPEMGPPDLETFAFEKDDGSWQKEFDAFLAEIAGKKTDIATLHDAKKAIAMVQAVYAQTAEIGSE